MQDLLELTVGSYGAEVGLEDVELAEEVGGDDLVELRRRRGMRAPQFDDAELAQARRPCDL